MELPSTPADLLAYQEGGIVSRIIMKKPNGSITLFAFDKGQEVSEHTTPFEALAQVLEGEAEIRISGKSHAVGAGQALLLPPDVPHAVRAPQRFKMLLTMLRS